AVEHLPAELNGVHRAAAVPIVRGPPGMAADAVNDEPAPKDSVAERRDAIGCRLRHDSGVGAITSIDHGERPHAANFLIDHGRKDNVARGGGADLLENLDRHQHAGDAALHVDRPTSSHKAFGNDRRERVAHPWFGRARRYDVDMARQHDRTTLALALE